MMLAAESKLFSCQVVSGTAPVSRRFVVTPRQWLLCSVLSLLTTFGSPAIAQTVPKTESARTVNQWLTRMHEASRQRAYTGTLVVSAGSAMSASRIWHVCDGTQQMERIETLSGAPRTTIRHNNDVITFAPDEKTAWVEKRESLGLFPELLRTPANQIPEYYGVRESGVDRVAGYPADVVDIVPKDDWRFGFRIWSEKASGLVLKLQTLDPKGRVLEQLAFTELQLNAPVRMEKLSRMMKDTKGYEVRRAVLGKTSPDEQGWRLKESVPGFLLMGCHTHRDEALRSPVLQVLQCVYSDGLSSVSLFIEPEDVSQQSEASNGAVGATHSMSRRIGAFDVTVMGEVPPATLRRFSDALERTR